MLILGTMKRLYMSLNTLMSSSDNGLQLEQMHIMIKRLGLHVCCQTPILKFEYARSLTVHKDWDKPYSFFNSVYHVKNEEGTFQRNITGSRGTFLNMW